MKWFKFDVREQKTVRMLLQYAQHEKPKEFRLFDVAKINLETAAEVGIKNDIYLNYKYRLEEKGRNFIWSHSSISYQYD